MHLSSLIIILIFGLVIANMKLFFGGKLVHFLKKDRAHQIYHELHIITLETAFIVRTFFFVVFGITIVLSSLFNLNVALVSVLILLSIYAIRFVLLRLFLGSDFLPQLFIAPRGLITVLLFYAIPTEAEVATFEPGILLFVIIGTSLIMTWAMIKDKRKTATLVDELDKTYKERDEAYKEIEQEQQGELQEGEPTEIIAGEVPEREILPEDSEPDPGDTDTEDLDERQFEG